MQQVFWTPVYRSSHTKTRQLGFAMGAKLEGAKNHTILTKKSMHLPHVATPKASFLEVNINIIFTKHPGNIETKTKWLTILPASPNYLTNPNKLFFGGGPLNKSLPQPFFQLRCRLILRTSRLMPATTGPTSTSTMRGNVVPMNTRVPMLWADFCCLVELMRSWGIQMGQGLEMIVVFLGFSLFFFGHLDSEVTRICSFRMDIYDYLCVCWSFWNIISACKY